MPEMPQDPTTSRRAVHARFMRNVHRLMRDATTMPALGDYHSQYLHDLSAVRKATASLGAAVDRLAVAMDHIIDNYSNRQLMPQYFDDMCADFDDVDWT